MAPTTNLHALAEHGQSVWIDFLSRRFVEDGELEELVRTGVHGVTSNPTIFQSAIAEGGAEQVGVDGFGSEDEELHRLRRYPRGRRPTHRSSAANAAAAATRL